MPIKKTATAKLRQIRPTTCEKQSNSARAAGLRIFAFCILLFDFFPLLQVYARTKQHLIMQNKANFRRATNDCNLSYNKHLRTQTTPPTTKKQSQFKAKTKPIKANFKPGPEQPGLSTLDANK